MSEYPTAIKRKVEGDWNCQQCNNLNYSFRNTCNRCETTKTVFESEYPGFASALFFTLPMMEDIIEDENNPAVNERLGGLPSVSPFFTEKFMTMPTVAQPITGRVLSFEKENVTRQKNPQVISRDALGVCNGKSVAEILSKVKKPHTERDGDWVCLKCKNLNFAFRNECNKCKGKKDSYIAM